MLVLAALSFACGIYLGALYNIPLKFTLPFLPALLVAIPFLINRKDRVASILILVGFMVAGIARLGIGMAAREPLALDKQKCIYEAVVTDASPTTKILALTRPDTLEGLKVIFRTPENLAISDRVRVFGEAREVIQTFKNPHIISWRWLKGLEGVSYEVKGMLLSVSPGTDRIHALRNMLRKKIETSGARHSEIIKALTIGDTTGLDEATKTLFLRTGTSHILAVSGSNVGIITAFFFFILRWLVGRVYVFRLRGDDTRYAALLTIPFAITFMLVAGAGIPVIRATIMVVVYMFSLFFERNRHLTNTLALSGLVLLLVYPHSLFTASFQLTFASVLFIIIFTEKFYPLLKTQNRLARWLILSVSMTVAATLGTLPITLYHFYGFNPFSVIHNLISVPLMCVLAMPLSLLGIVLPLGEHLLRLAGEIVSLNTTILNLLDAGYLYPIIRPDLFEIAFYFALVLSLVYAKKKLIPGLVVCVLLPATTVYGYISFERRFNNDLRVSFFDVGNGDAILIEGPKGTRILIDGGGLYKGEYDTGRSILTPILLSKKIRTLDYVINTHPHGDHIGGIPYIVANFSVRCFAASNYFIKEEKFIALMKLIRQKEVPVRTLRTGDTITLPDGFEILTLSPDANESFENLNNASLVLKATHRAISFLLTGDIDSGVEEHLIMSSRKIQANILKIPHHGSRYSSSHAFLQAVRPDLAVLSAGTGIKGIPSNEALERYQGLSIPVARTDTNGWVEVTAQRDRIVLQCFRNNSSTDSTSANSP
ncbi:MAG: ComEC family competence protein [Syntrophorhabdus sp. PtaU1.Bin153]|nr:MAG: ComEC family competence protein [Syntrophorhabdus sp. PtaU1.Bin153]